MKAWAGAPRSNTIPRSSRNSILAFWAASRKWADKNPEAIASFRKCVKDAVTWINANGDRAREIEKQYLGFNTPIRPDWNADIKGEDFTVYVDLNLELGVMRKRVDVKDLVWARP